MEREQIVFVGTSDLSGHFRGKSFPAADLPARLQRGVGLAPTNIFISAFGPIQVTTFGTIGEVLLVPDPATRVFVPFAGSTTEYFFIGDIRTLEGAPWEFCPRHILRRALDRLRSETGHGLLASFEQEFIYDGVAGHPWQPYELDAYRRQGLFGEALLAAMRQAGLDGIRHKREIDLTSPRSLPTSLGEALRLLEASESAAEWLGADVLSAYLLFKRAEIKAVENLDENAICRRYAEVY
jgi:glutamine synthetase